jgi:hypothetical protein
MGFIARRGCDGCGTLLLRLSCVLQWFLLCCAVVPLCVSQFSGPREDATRIGSAGVVRRQAVDISPLRRVNQAIWLLTTGKSQGLDRWKGGVGACSGFIRCVLLESGAGCGCASPLGLYPPC